MTDIVFTDVYVLDGSGDQPFVGEVRISGDRIKAIARNNDRVDRYNADVIDGHGKTLMPGLVESHGHLTFGDTATPAELGDIPP